MGNILIAGNSWVLKLKAFCVFVGLLRSPMNCPILEPLQTPNVS